MGLQEIPRILSTFRQTLNFSRGFYNYLVTPTTKYYTMKNAILISVLTLITSTIFANTYTPTHDVEDVKKTIILINGIAVLVDIDANGKVINNYLLVPDYFSSNDAHDLLVEKAEVEYEEELAILDRSKLIIFGEESAMLNEAAVDNIRTLANLYNYGSIQNVNITAGHVENADDEDTVNDRINAITQMLEDFGVKEGDISADVKIYRSELPNQFVKIDLVK